MIVVEQCLVAVVETGVTRWMGLWHGFRVDLKAALLLCRQSLDFFLTSLSVVVFNRLDVLILSQMVGEEAVGYYTAAYLILRVINFLSVSYSNAAYPVLSRLFSTARARFEILLNKSLLFGTTITLLIAILLATAAEPIIGLLYQGEEYATSVFLLRIEAPFVVIFMWNALLASGLMSSNLQRRSVIVSGVKLVTGLVYYLLLTAQFGATGTAVATVLAGLTGTVLNYYFLNKEVHTLDLVSLVVKPLTIGAILIVILWIAQGLAWPALVVGGTFLYILLLIVFRIFSREDVRLLWRMVRLL
jgi:O-antigen/teichoic acid export membrane protein